VNTDSYRFEKTVALEKVFCTHFGWEFARGFEYLLVEICKHVMYLFVRPTLARRMWTLCMLNFVGAEYGRESLGENVFAKSLLVDLVAFPHGRQHKTQGIG